MGCDLFEDQKLKKLECWCLELLKELYEEVEKAVMWPVHILMNINMTVIGRCLIANSRLRPVSKGVIAEEGSYSTSPDCRPSKADIAEDRERGWPRLRGRSWGPCVHRRRPGRLGASGGEIFVCVCIGF